MSIQILDTPEDFQPVYSDGLFFTISADTTNNFKFRYTYNLQVNGTTVFEGKSTPNPYGLGVVDLSRILKTYTTNMPISNYNTTPIYTHQTFPFSRPYDDEVINYQVYFGYEYADSANGAITGFTGSGSTIGPPSVPSSLYKTFYSTMGVNGRATQQDFNIDPFVLSGTPIGVDPTTSGLFLTNSPRIRNVRDEDFYTLAFTNYYLNSGSMLSEPYYVEYNFYDDEGVLLDTQRYQNFTQNGGGPLTDCSAVYPSYYNIVTTGNTDWNTLYVGAGPMNLDDVMPAGTAQYTVQLFGKFTGSTTPIQPTPTPTPTPSSTPQCATCYQYYVTNLMNNPITFTYQECVTGVIRTVALDTGLATIVNCACAGSIQSEFEIDVVQGVPCITPTPTPSVTMTATPGLSPTPTPTPFVCVCEEVEIYNPNAFTIVVEGFDCYGDGVGIIVNSGDTQLVPFCVCSNTLQCEFAFTVYPLSSCIIPSPTATPTRTPTPTPTLGGTPFELGVCTGGGCSGGECQCLDVTLENVYMAPGTDPSMEGENIYQDPALTMLWFGTYQYGNNIYDASPIAFVCVVGGPC